jgi:hypothetical protein
MIPLEPWIWIRLIVGIIALSLFGYAAWVALKILRFYRLRSRAEGQLALERQAELASTLARVGAGVLLLSLLLSVWTADRLSSEIRGAMCGYGVVHANAAGPWSLACTMGTALVAGIYLEILRFERHVRGLELMRPLALITLVLSGLTILDFSFAYQWLAKLDLSVVASCCSTSVDSAAGATQGWDPSSGSLRQTIGITSIIATVLSVGVGFWMAKRPARAGIVGAAWLGLVTLVLALGATVHQVAPYVYEVPYHHCPYCLFKADVFGFGYPIYGTMFLAAIWVLSAGSVAWISRVLPNEQDWFASFAGRNMWKGAWAWLLVLALGLAPWLRFRWLTGGASLFP